jgi:hypothetical protein
MTARDEFAEDISTADRAHKNDPVDPTTHYSYVIADELIADGYSKPRTITSVEDLDALPVGTVTIDCGGAGEVYRKLAHADGIKWYEPSYAIHWESHELKLPVLVIWDPRP